MYRVHVRIRGVDYPSIAEAARQLGLHYSTIRGMLDRGYVDGAGLGRNHHTRIEIVVAGVTYRTMVDAANAIGVDANTLAHKRRDAAKAGKRVAYISGVEFTWITPQERLAAA